MYSTLLALHSSFRWLVLLSLLFAIYRGFRGWIIKREFSRFDNSIRHWTATIAHIQLILGLGIYYISPVINYFFSQFNEAVHQREVRFFGMEHSLMMLLAIGIITWGSVKTRLRINDTEKYRTMALWFLAALLIILSSIPWGFSPLVSRPYFRWF